MKTFVEILIVFGLFAGRVHGQQIIEKHLEFEGKESVTLEIQIADSINIQTWNKDEIYIKASVNINDNKDNAAYETHFDESARTVVVRANFRENYFKGKNNCCTEADIFWQVYLPEKAKFTVETINADITITGQTSEMNVKSISGFIDLALPASKQADIDFSTITGLIYSNHKLTLDKLHTGIPSRINEKFNNGGDLIRLETISGDIFFRKSN
jgi:hypothetical protein